MFRSDDVEIASDGGWFTTRRDDFSAGAWRRTQAALVNVAAVRAVAVTLVGLKHEPFPCLNLLGDATNSSVLVALVGSSEPGRCGEQLGDDQLWRYTRPIPEGQVQATGQGGTGERRLVAGHFTDDIVVGMPVAQRNGESHDYLIPTAIPTAAGVLRINADLHKKALISDFVGMEAGRIPTALYIWDADTPAYLEVDGIYRIGDNTLLSQISLDIPVGAIVESLEDGPREMLVARWSQDSRREWSLYDPISHQGAMRNRLLVDLSHLRRFQQNWLNWGRPTAIAELAVLADRAELYWPNPTTPATFSYPLPAEIFAAIGDGERVLFFGRHEIYELQLAPALRAAFAEKRRTP